MNGSNGPHICPTGTNHNILIISILVGTVFISLVAFMAFFCLYWKARKDKQLLQKDKKLLQYQNNLQMENFHQIEQGNQTNS